MNIERKIFPNITKDFGNIGLKSESKTLQEVSITALRPTITMKADRMVVSVEGTAMAAGTNAYSVLAKAPGVFIDPEGNIQLNGRSGVTVMIDGRLTFLSARDLRSMLEGMSAENLKNIEIITNPSAKYDAEGTSGILNINLKKNTQRGMNGSLYSNLAFNEAQPDPKLKREIERLLDQQFAKVKAFLDDHRDEVIAIAEELLEKEDLTGDDVIDILNDLEQRKRIAAATAPTNGVALPAAADPSL